MITTGDLQKIGIFACLEQSEIARFAGKAADMRLAPGDWLVREGEPAPFAVVLEGRLRMVKDILGSQEEIQTYSYQAGDFFGEVPLMLGTSALVSLRAEEACRVARFDRQQFQELIRDSPAASAIILQKMNERLLRVQTYAAQIPVSRVLIVGTTYDTDCREIRRFLAANRIPYEWIDRSTEPERVPSCIPKDLAEPGVVVDHRLCVHPPTVRAVAEALELQTQPKSDHYDVLIAGAGPAGMAAGVYGASEGLKVLMVEQSAAGGQAGTSSRIENYLGFPEGVSGEDLTGRALKQALRFGAEIAMTRCVEALAPFEDGYCLDLDGGQRVAAKAVVLATGVDWRRLTFPGADRFLGRGILYGASRTEANSVIGKRVAIIGGGNSAGQAAMFFSNYAAEVTVMVRGEGLKLTMSHYLISEIASKDNIEVMPYTEVISSDGDDHLERINVRTRRPQEAETVRTYDLDALFIMIGADSNTGWLPAELERDERGFILTGRDLRNWPLPRPPFLLETSLPGVFCAGDVRHDSIKRVSSGVGEGSMAIAFIHQYLALQEVSQPASA